jgi:hypothetical protein
MNHRSLRRELQLVRQRQPPIDPHHAHGELRPEKLRNSPSHFSRRVPSASGATPTFRASPNGCGAATNPSFIVKTPVHLRISVGPRGSSGIGTLAAHQQRGGCEAQAAFGF